MTDYDNPPQHKRRVHMRLNDLRGNKLFDGKAEVWSGPPIGDWVEFRKVRIALKRINDKEFDGLVPDI